MEKFTRRKRINNIKTKKKENDKRMMDVYLRRLEKQFDKSKERYDYAIKQFDALMITLSTVGIGFISNYTKDMEGDLTLAYISQLIFTICFFSNLISHLASKRCYKISQIIDNAELDSEHYNIHRNQDAAEKFKKAQDKMNAQMGLYNIVVKVLNSISFLSLSSAVICFVVFAIKLKQ